MVITHNFTEGVTDIVRLTVHGAVEAVETIRTKIEVAAVAYQVAHFRAGRRVQIDGTSERCAPAAAANRQWRRNRGSRGSTNRGSELIGSRCEATRKIRRVHTRFFTTREVI